MPRAHITPGAVACSENETELGGSLEARGAGAAVHSSKQRSLTRQKARTVVAGIRMVPIALYV